MGNTMHKSVIAGGKMKLALFHLLLLICPLQCLISIPNARGLSKWV